ncbi:uncharacterized protein [Typha latifolia]|uniref:uncharacterized protein n=1 Tax=Typha latifolia TaxID=4733 RepID=UPI003C2C1957
MSLSAAENRVKASNNVATPESSDGHELLLPAETLLAEPSHTIKNWLASVTGKSSKAPDPTGERQKKLEKVPELLRNNKEKGKPFDPVIVAIGPYHHFDEHLAGMEDHKKAATYDFTGGQMDVFCHKVAGVAQEAKRMYLDVPPVMNESDFTLMLLFDGCFVLHFIDMLVTGRSYWLRMSTHLHGFILRDMFLLENQIPYIVLDALMSVRKVDIDKFLDQIVEIEAKGNGAGGNDSRNVGGNGSSDVASGPQGLAHLLAHLREKHLGQKNDNDGRLGLVEDNSWLSFRSAKELSAAGIKLCQSGSHHMRDVSFEPHYLWGKLMLPRMVVDDLTRSRLLNMVAFEMCLGAASEYGITSFVWLLDCLIDHADDVKELRKKGILLNALGSDEQVADLFNEIATDLTLDQQPYNEVLKKIASHCGSKTKVFIYQLKDTHFSSPWTTISFVAAVVLLVLTVVQTIFTIRPGQLQAAVVAAAAVAATTAAMATAAAVGASAAAAEAVVMDAAAMAVVASASSRSEAEYKSILKLRILQIGYHRQHPDLLIIYDGQNIEELLVSSLATQYGRKYSFLVETPLDAPPTASFYDIMDYSLLFTRPGLNSILTGYLPSAVLNGFIYLIPYSMLAMASLEGCVSKSKRDMKACSIVEGATQSSRRGKKKTIPMEANKNVATPESSDGHELLLPAETLLAEPSHTIKNWLASVTGKSSKAPDPTGERQKKLHKVPQLLRNNKEKGKPFDPVIVAIGPYHHFDEHLAGMEDHKKAATNDFAGAQMDVYYCKVADVAQEAKRMYVDVPPEMSETDFTLMLFFDGCFVLHFIDKFVKGESKDLQISTHLHGFILRDMLLLENQIPYIVLNALMSEKKVDIDKFLNQIVGIEAKGNGAGGNGSSDVASDLQGHAHLLAHLREKHLGQETEKALLDWVGNNSWLSFRSAKELSAAGIKLCQSGSQHMRDVRFEPYYLWGKLTLPRMVVDDLTRSRLLNMVAFEMCPGAASDYGITSFVWLLDCLIDHVDDVKELRKKGILLNALGSDEQVAELFNEIATDLAPDQQAYNHVLKQIASHCGCKTKVTIYQLIDTHFSSPWTAISFVAAVVLLGLTVVQTIFTIRPAK